MKVNLLIIILISVLFIWGCTEQKDLEADIIDLENIIYKCNNQIEEAKSYVWESYEDMEDALNNLETCN